MTQAQNISAALLQWYATQQRVLPWRVVSPAVANPYEVWLSEIMLQQTTVATVKGYFQKFIETWATIEQLAAADLNDVLHAWQGLGYYARARNLHKAAQQIVAEHGGVFPQTEKELRKLTGVGAYTAAAVAAFAFHQRAVVVDSNVERIIARLYAIDKPVKQIIKKIYALTDSLTPVTRAGDFAQGMMDLGFLICTARAPKCGECPLVGSCLAFAQQKTACFPVKPVKKPRPTRYGAVLWLENTHKEVWVRRRPPKGLLGGLMEIPSTEWLAIPLHHNTALDLCSAAVLHNVLPQTIEHTFTHFHLTLTITKATLPFGTPLPNGEWLKIESFQSRAWSTLMKKVIVEVEKSF